MSAEACPEEGTMPTPAVVPSLLDWPAPWLRQLVNTLGSKELVLMSQTCRTMQQEVLTGRGVTLSASMYRPGADEEHISLQRACQLAGRLHLKLTGRNPVAHKQKAEDEVDAEPTAPEHDPLQTAQGYLANAVAAMGGPLTKVTQVTLQGMSLTALVPTWLTDACPNLTTLSLDTVTLDLSDQPTPPSTNATLKHLSMPATSDDERSADSVVACRQHLEALTALQQLTITTPLSSSISACVHNSPLLHQRLTSLCLPQQKCLAGLSVLLRAGWPALTDLQIPTMMVDTGLFEDILQLPALRSLTCESVGLPADYQWQFKTFNLKHLSVQLLDVTSTAKLPLDSLEGMSMLVRTDTVGVESGRCVIMPSADPAANARVLSTVQRMGGLKWVHEKGFANIHIVPEPQRLMVDSQLASAVLLLIGYKAPRLGTQLCVSSAVNPATLKSIQDASLYLQHHGHMSLLRLMGHSADPDSWPLLLPSCSWYHCIGVHLDNVCLTEAAVTQALSPVPRPIKANISAASLQAKEGWLERVEEAASAGAAAVGLRNAVQAKLLKVEYASDSTVVCQVHSDKNKTPLSLAMVTVPKAVVIEAENKQPQLPKK